MPTRINAVSLSPASVSNGGSTKIQISYDTTLSGLKVELVSGTLEIKPASFAAPKTSKLVTKTIKVKLKDGVEPGHRRLIKVKLGAAFPKPKYIEVT